MKNLIAIDLFSGCGGLTLGLKLAGFKVVGAIENDELAARTYRANHPQVRVWNADIKRVAARAVMRELGLRTRHAFRSHLSHDCCSSDANRNESTRQDLLRRSRSVYDRNHWREPCLSWCALAK
jgi:hypothetical protein